MLKDSSQIEKDTRNGHSFVRNTRQIKGCTDEPSDVTNQHLHCVLRVLENFTLSNFLYFDHNLFSSNPGLNP